MEKINFINGQAPAINGTNLNQMQTNTENAINEVDTKLEDSGWKDIPLAEGVSVGIIAEKPQYRKVGKRVDIKGSYSFTKTSDNDLLATLPEGFRPTGYIYLLAPIGGPTAMRVFIQANGKVYSEWIYNLADNTKLEGQVNWCDIRTSYYVD